MNDNLREKIEAYLEQKLSPEEVRLFEKEIERNAELREEILLVKQINNHLSGNKDFETEIPNNEYREKLHSFFNSDDASTIENTLLKVQKEYKEKRNSTTKNRKYYKSIAATVLVLVLGSIGYLIFNQTNETDLFDQYYSNKDLPSTIQRGDQQSLFTKGVLEFEKENYKSALSYFKKYKEQNKEYNTAFFLYSGVTYTQLKKYELALIEFDIVISSNSLDYSKGLWFKTLAYLKAKDIENTKITLNIILEKESNFKYKKAKKLLKEL